MAFPCSPSPQRCPTLIPALWCFPCLGKASPTSSPFAWHWFSACSPVTSVGPWLRARPLQLAHRLSSDHTITDNLQRVHIQQVSDRIHHHTSRKRSLPTCREYNPLLQDTLLGVTLLRVTLLGDTLLGDTLLGDTLLVGWSPSWRVSLRYRWRCHSASILTAGLDSCDWSIFGV